MFTRRYTINIDNPCTQNWDAMAATEQGRLCAHCTTEVMDFSSMSDEEIIAIISKKKGHICGRFTSDQVGRDLSPIKDIKPLNRLYKIAASVLLLIGIEVKAAHAQTADVKPEHTVTKNRFVDEKKVVKPIVKQTSANKICRIRVVTGKSPLPDGIYNAMVIAKIGDTTITKYTNYEGFCEINLMENSKIDDIKLKIKYPNFYTRRIIIDKNNIEKLYTINIRPIFIQYKQRYVKGKVILLPKF